jgi:hypothetical protein
VPGPSRRAVVPLGKRLLHPLHYFGKLQPVLRPDIKRKQIALKTPPLNLEDKPEFRLMKHPVKNRQGLFLPEQRSAISYPTTDFSKKNLIPRLQGGVVRLGADFVPHTLFEFS